MKKSIRFTPEQITGFDINADGVSLETLEALGVGIGPHCLKSFADAMPGTITAENVGNPMMFLQAFYQKAIEIVTAKRVSDDLFGREIVGNFFDDNVVLTTTSFAGHPNGYGDLTRVPLASYNTVRKTAKIRQFKLGLEMGLLEGMRAAAVGLPAYENKRRAVSEGLAILRNAIAFYGVKGNTYGFLNHPELPPFITVSTGSGGDTRWATKTYAEIQADIRGMIADLIQRSGQNVDPETQEVVLAVPGSVSTYLYTTPPQTGMGSVLAALQATYKGLRVVKVPQLENAVGGENAAYLFSQTVGTSPVFIHAVQEVMRLLGVTPRATVNTEEYGMATAGLSVGNAAGVVRYIGV